MNNKDISTTTAQTPTLAFQADGSPISTVYNDIYFDTLSGGQQSEQVFINGNNIKTQLENKQKHGDNAFTIGETGFGTGLNFLLTLSLYQEFLAECLKSNSEAVVIPLHFISTEKHPLTKQQIEQSLTLWQPQLAPQISLLLKYYPVAPQLGQHLTLTIIDKYVTLTLIFDDASEGFSRTKVSKQGLVDAWYLDGFSPTKNPDMWSEALFEQVARLSKSQATLATFTIAGVVRRRLNKVGFRTKKKNIDGKKNEILIGSFQQGNNLGKGYQLRPKITKPMHVSIVGGGIASACAAYALTKKGIKVVLYCKDNEIAQGASSNVMGALFPLLHQQRDDISDFYEQAFWRARELYTELHDDGYSFAHQWCGLLEISYKESLAKRQQKFESNNVWSHNLIHGINAEQASQLANIKLANGGLFMPKAGWICPPELVNALLQAASKTNRLTIETDTHITHINALETSNQDINKEINHWQLTSNKGTFTASTLVVCGGADSININIIDELPMSPVRGQVSNMKANTALNNLTTVICHKGYLTPSYQNVQCIGATFDKNTTDIAYREKDDHFNLKMLSTCLPDLPQWQTNDVASSKARLRCVTPDHLPMVGVVPKTVQHITTYHHLAKDKNWRYDTPQPCYEHLYVLSGLGARGLCSAPLLADILTADLTGEPYPVDNSMLFNLSPNRFVIRDIIKRKYM